MRTLLQVSIVAGLALVVGACTGNMQDLPVGLQCGVGGQPIPMTPDGNRKAIPQYSPADHPLPPGHYTYKYADMYFTQINNANPVELQVHDAADGNGTSTGQSMTCAHNAQAFKSLNVDAEAVTMTDLIVCPNYGQIVTTRQYALTADGGKVKLAITPNSDSSSIPPIYSSQTKIYTTMFTQNPIPGEYEFRAQYGDGKTGDSVYYMDTRMQMTADFTANPAAIPLDCATVAPASIQQTSPDVPAR
jgi:hypothetical protein